MDQALTQANVSPQQKRHFSISRYITYWPSLVQAFQDIHQTEALPLKAEKMQALRNQVDQLDAEVREQGELLLRDATELGDLSNSTILSHW